MYAQFLAQNNFSSFDKDNVIALNIGGNQEIFQMSDQIM